MRRQYLRSEDFIMTKDPLQLPSTSSLKPGPDLRRSKAVMASCGGGGGACESGCARREEDELAVEENVDKLEKLSISAGARCSKCIAEPPAYNGLCASCLRAALFNKFKLAVTSNAMISPTDKLLVAFSGGPSSRVALQFVHEMQCKSLKNWDASRSQALPVFGVGVAFIDERVVSSHPSHVIDEAIEEIKEILLELAPAHKELHIVPLESICSLGSQDGRSRLNGILDTITDSTGKEDFLQYLRMISLQKIAVDNGYTKLVLGSCTSRISRHIISATVKGQGYSLPADLQYVDARWEIPVVFPLRDCLAQELSMLCHLDGLQTQQLLERPCIGINSLVSSFVARLQDENPSRERTIVRTAEKLKPFSFNKLVENGFHDFLPSRIRPKFQNVKHDESTPSWILCPICGSPLSELDVQSFKSTHQQTQSRADIFVACCCQSCSFQILPKDAVSLDYFYSLLPLSMIQRATDSISDKQNGLREQIKDYVLADDGDDDDHGDET